MTSFALVIWAYEQSGSALSTALLSICSYAQYVLLSIFAGVLFDRWNKKATMLICDAARRSPPSACSFCSAPMRSACGAWVRCSAGCPFPLMNANLDVLFRTHIPVKMQGRVYAARNSLQFFTIPLGYLLGGALDRYRLRAVHSSANTRKAFSAACSAPAEVPAPPFLFLVLGFLGVAVCLGFRRSKLIRGLEANDKD